MRDVAWWRTRSLPSLAFYERLAPNHRLPRVLVRQHRAEDERRARAPNVFGRRGAPMAEALGERQLRGRRSARVVLGVHGITVLAACAVRPLAEARERLADVAWGSARPPRVAPGPPSAPVSRAPSWRPSGLISGSVRAMVGNPVGGCRTADPNLRVRFFLSRASYGRA